MNPQMLLDQFLGPQTGAATGEKLRSATSVLSAQGAKGAVGGLAAGGLLGLLVGSKKARKAIGGFAGGAVGYGGAAALGALAHRAYQKWQDQKEQASPGAPNGGDQSETRHAAHGLSDPPSGSQFAPLMAAASDGGPFALALIRAMISAGNDDGHISQEESKSIVSHVSSLPLDANDKAFVLDALMNPSTLADIAELATDAEQATEIYLVSRMAIDPDHPAERAYLDDLARRLALPSELVTEIESQATARVPMAA